MGCFTTCFGSSKHSNIRKPSSVNLVQDPNLYHDREINEALQCIYSTSGAKIKHPIVIASAIKENAEEELKGSERKKVSYHADVMTSSCPLPLEEVNPLVDTDEVNVRSNGEKQKRELRAFLLDSNEKKQKASNKDEGAAADSGVSSQFTYPPNEKEPKEMPAKSKDGEAEAADSSVSSLFTYPLNHRYHNCTTSDDESEVMGMDNSDLADEVNCQNAEFDSNDKGKDDLEVSDLEKIILADKVDCQNNDFDNKGKGEDDSKNRPLVQEESSGSLFSLSIDSRKHISTVEAGEKEVSSPFKTSSFEMNNQNVRDRSQYIHSVLNPISNMSQWRAVKEKTSSPLKENQENENKNLEQETTGKENLYIEQESKSTLSGQQSFKKSKQNSRQVPKEDEVAVDTSLSSWLMTSGKSQSNDDESSPLSSVGNSFRSTNSTRRFDDRPILGTLTLDELKQKSRLTSPPRSPSCSPEDMPIIGTVGSYWKQMGQQAMDPNWNTPSRGGSTRNSGQCLKVNRKGDSTPFQKRLEKALDTGSAEA